MPADTPSDPPAKIPDGARAAITRLLGDYDMPALDPATEARCAAILHQSGPLRAGSFIRQIKAVNAPAASKGSAPQKCGPYIFKAQDMVLEDIHGHIRTRLTDKERDILAYLLDAPDHTASRQELLSAVWGYKDGLETHTLETHIYRLRQKIENDAANPQILQAAAGGYRLIA